MMLIWYQFIPIWEQNNLQILLSIWSTTKNDQSMHIRYYVDNFNIFIEWWIARNVRFRQNFPLKWWSLYVYKWLLRYLKLFTATCRLVTINCISVYKRYKKEKLKLLNSTKRWKFINISNNIGTYFLGFLKDHN